MEQFQVKGRTLVIRMPKELDHHTTGQIPQKADRMIGERNIQRIEFDFRDTGFMDSSGIGVIMGRYQKLRLLGGSVAATHVSDRIWRILHLAGVTKVLEVEKERNWQLSGTLSGGEQQMLAVARALMSHPKILMMDEPSLGLAPLIVKDIFSIIQEINKKGVTVLLIEQNANMALHTADRGYVLETGRITLSGSGKELLADESVKAAYLGKKKA